MWSNVGDNLIWKNPLKLNCLIYDVTYVYLKKKSLKRLGNTSDMILLGWKPVGLKRLGIERNIFNIGYANKMTQSIVIC